MSDFKTWDQMSELEQAQATWWDMYKDAHGVRPRGINTDTWTLEDFEKEFELLSKVIKDQETRRLEEEAAAIRQFESLISKSIVAGAPDRETAIQWIMDAADCFGDWDFLCFKYGLPYNYFNKSFR